MVGELKNWTECDIWKELETRDTEHAEECRTTLRAIMPKIQDILHSGGTSPKDFTLHDAGHSFRVAERMQEIMGEQTKRLTAFEFSLLLLSAYLHDIGMTPEFEKVEGIFRLLLNGEKQSVPDGEIAELQTWIDNEGYQVVPPIDKALPPADRLTLAREITTYYCRYRHNDWSKEWINKNLQSIPLDNYSGWVNDLILLCDSHHFGFDRLMEKLFRARRVGSPSEIVNLRYLALVLRMADILELDPERTPDVILRHRSISEKSQIYWAKDSGLSLNLSDGKIVITARPSSALVHKAIEETMDAIDVEMSLCRKIADESPLGAIPGEELTPYPWTLPAACHRNVEPREGTYEYINGAFRPDTQKLLSLLSGTALYQTPFHAVRELIQNSFDAVAEKIAYLRLSQPDPSNARLAKQSSEQHRVSLQLEVIESDAYLICTDSGIGMTKAIIRDRVLVSGSGPRHDVRALERRAKDAGFDLGRSGQFGIGVLSYFMIATTVEIETLRALEAGDSESTAWFFETAGIGSFGELRRLKRNFSGTRVRLRLNRNISTDPIGWYKDLHSYLRETLVYCPCEFHLTSPLPECAPLELKPGWSSRDYAREVVADLNRRSHREEPKDWRILPSAEREQWLAIGREIAQLGQEIKSSLKWIIEEGTLSDGSAHYELHFPYFEVSGQPSLAFVALGTADSAPIVKDLLGGTHFRPAGNFKEAWRGMAIGGNRLGIHFGGRYPRGLFGRINWTSHRAGELAVNRNEFVPNANVSAYAEVHSHWTKLLENFANNFKDSQFSWLNERIAKLPSIKATSCKWLRINNDALSWEDVKFPAINRASFGYSPPDGELELDKKPVHVIPWSVPAPNPLGSELRAIGWNSKFIPPDRVVFLNSWQFRVVPLWLRGPRSTSDRPWLESMFPPQWRHLCGAKFPWYAGNGYEAIVWNPANYLVKELTPSAWKWCEETFLTSIVPLPHRETLLSELDKAAAWILQCVSADSSSIWDGLPERDSSFLTELLGSFFSHKKSSDSLSINFWVENANPFESWLRVLDTRQWKVVKQEQIWQYVSMPPLTWTVEEANSAGKRRIATLPSSLRDLDSAPAAKSATRRKERKPKG